MSIISITEIPFLNAFPGAAYVQGRSTALLRCPAGPVCAGTLLLACWWKGSLLTLTRYPAMHTQFSRRTVTAIILLLVAATVPYKAQAQSETQSYPIAEALAAYFEMSANAEELTARAHYAWANAGGECGEETETCSEWAAESRESAERIRATVKTIRENLSLYNEPAPGKTVQDQARLWRALADENEGNAALSLDYVDQARLNTELERNVRTWTRAVEAAERVAEAHEARAELAYALADLWDKRADN